jgi:hypothetical protein
MERNIAGRQEHDRPKMVNAVDSLYIGTSTVFIRSKATGRGTGASGGETDLMSARKLDALSQNSRKPLIEGRDYVTDVRGADGVRLSTIPLPLPSAPRDAPWGRDEQGRLIAPFGIGKNGHPRRRVSGSRRGESALLPGGYLPPISQAIERRLANIGCDPIAVLAQIAMNEKTEALVRVKAASELLAYIYPKRRSVEVKGETTTKHTFVIEIPSGGQLTSDQWLDRVNQARDVTPNVDVGG